MKYFSVKTIKVAKIGAK